MIIGSSPGLNPARWPAAEPISSDRLALEPLRVKHATEMAAALNDPALHHYIGGAPATADELADRYAKLVVGSSPDGTERWLNWIVRFRDTAAAVGYVQATVTGSDGHLEAEVAWVIASAQQGQGFAQESARLMVGWLREHGVALVVAHIHPDHRASEIVARRIGLSPTGGISDGEIRWAG